MVKVCRPLYCFTFKPVLQCLSQHSDSCIKLFYIIQFYPLLINQNFKLIIRSVKVQLKLVMSNPIILTWLEDKNLNWKWTKVKLKPDKKEKVIIIQLAQPNLKKKLVARQLFSASAKTTHKVQLEFIISFCVNLSSWLTWKSELKSQNFYWQKSRQRAEIRIYMQLPS